MSAAAAFLATPELRSQLFSILDKPTLAVLARCAKALTYDVAQVLYHKVDFSKMRHRMSRQTVRQPSFIQPCYGDALSKSALVMSHAAVEKSV